MERSWLLTLLRWEFKWKKNRTTSVTVMEWYIWHLIGWRCSSERARFIFFKRFSTDMVASGVPPFYLRWFWKHGVLALYQVVSHQTRHGKTVNKQTVVFFSLFLLILFCKVWSFSLLYTHSFLTCGPRLECVILFQKIIKDPVRRVTQKYARSFIFVMNLVILNGKYTSRRKPYE